MRAALTYLTGLRGSLDTDRRRQAEQRDQHAALLQAAADVVTALDEEIADIDQAIAELES